MAHEIATMLLVSLSDLVDEHMHNLISIQAPSWYLNSELKIVLQGDAGREICRQTPLNFMDGLLEVLQHDAPPPPEFWLTTPVPDGKFWGVYALLMVKDEEEEVALYIGSGTEALRGCAKRMSDYSDENYHKLPRLARQAYERGFELCHIGVICWAPMPDATLIPRARRRFIALEGMFTNLFFSCIPTVMDDLWDSLVPWTRSQVAWTPLNSHSPLSEGAHGDIALGKEDLARAEADRKARVAQYSKKSYAKNGMKMRERYELARAQDIDAWRLKNRIRSRSRVSRNREKYREKFRASSRKHKQKNIDTQKFFCETCEKAFPDSCKLKKHLNTELHQRTALAASGVVRQLTSRQRIAKESADRRRSQKRHYCEVCRQTFSVPGQLARHLLTKKHAAAVSSIASVSSTESVSSMDSVNPHS
ncbi:hypothetical protein LZ554_000056 [Drepanopeziza brunnea f. sp. 'monogermtubi']|nr:hypothetical protein LZ554_000056 [Drepanopeziza brunnea f. sp. 'monogermtubi']